MELGYKIIAVDFDGTLCEDKWPEIGKPNMKLIEYLKERRAAGDKVILWTCRCGKSMEEAIRWCRWHDLYFDEVNYNLPEVISIMGGDTRKIYADVYIDDKMVNQYLDIPSAYPNIDELSKVVESLRVASSHVSVGMTTVGRALTNITRQTKGVFEDINALEKISGMSISTLTDKFLAGYTLNPPEPVLNQMQLYGELVHESLLKRDKFLSEITDENWDEAVNKIMAIEYGESED